jgi:hypothetical protein
MPELSLDREQRDPLARHLHRMGVPELMRGEAASDPGRRGGVMQLSAKSAGRGRRWPPLVDARSLPARVVAVARASRDRPGDGCSPVLESASLISWARVSGHWHGHATRV